VLHLGDYIYEYSDGYYGDSTLFDERPLDPATEIVTLEEYRARYSTYRLDTNLVRAHQQHPFIAVWDDHESANDAYTDGAENHDPATEGDWETRKAVSKQAYFEWMPIRDNADQQVYRSISYGDIMDLIMLDTRLEGRNEQIADATDPALQDPDRTLLGGDQKTWLFDQLSQSTAKWKVVAQQVIFAEFNVGWAALVDPTLDYFGYESIFLDIWDGYPGERAEIIQYIDDNQIDNVVVLTGDFHSTFAFDVPAMPIDLQFNDIPGVGTLPFFNPSDYDPVTGENSVLVEFATPSISSANFDENTDLTTAQLFQATINNNIEAVPGVLSLGNPNPHMKMNELIQHGYYVLDVKPDSVQANWYFTAIDTLTSEESFHDAWYTKDGENHLNQGGESAPKAEQDLPAPSDPPAPSSVLATRDFSVLGVYPNPCVDESFLHYSLTKRQPVQVRLFDESGRLLQTLVDETMPAGTFTLRTNTQNLRPGLYFYEVQVGEEVQTVKLVRAN
jgi:alkaline phosphatase D